MYACMYVSMYACMYVCISCLSVSLMDYCKQSSICIPLHSVSIRCAHAPNDKQARKHMCDRVRANPCTHELALTCLYLRCIVVFFCGRRNRHRTVGRRASPNPHPKAERVCPRPPASLFLSRRCLPCAKHGRAMRLALAKARNCAVSDVKVHPSIAHA